MNDFYFKSKDIYPYLREADKFSFDKVFDYFAKFSKVKHIMNSDFYNIEELLSIIEMDSFVTKNKTIKKHYLNYLKTVIEYFTPSKTNDKREFIIDDNKTTNLYTYFLAKVYGLKVIDDSFRGMKYYERDKNNDNGIISLNYDLLLENSLKKITDLNPAYMYSDISSFDFNYGIKDEYVEFSQKATADERILKFAKIHGSINFLKNNQPLIIPPTWNKTSNSAMIPVWQLAHSLIAQSNELVFIGYSLPATDLYVKYLLISGIEKCYNLKKIKVICPDDKNEVYKHYIQFFDSNFREKAFDFSSQTFEKWLEPEMTKKKNISFLK